MFIPKLINHDKYLQMLHFLIFYLIYIFLQLLIT